MKISIAMATYQGADFLEAQLQSFLRQVRLPDELVIVDDQSRDDTATIARAFAVHAPFLVRVEVNATNLGVTRNFDRALSLCTGDLVLLSDQDDVWLPEKIATLERAAHAHADRSCFLNDAILADAELRPNGATKMGQIEAAGLPPTALVMGCCAGIRRSLLACLLPIPQDQPAHDNWLVQMADLLDQTVRLEDANQYYRRHGRNVSDFFVNRLDAPGRIEALRHRVGRLVRQVRSAGGFGQELAFLALAAERMADRSDALGELAGPQRVAQARARTEARLEVLLQRNVIRGLPRTRRVRPVWDLWIHGAYRTSGRVRGALKDLFIGRTEDGDSCA